MLLKVATAVNTQTRRTFVVIEPQYQPKPDRIRIIKDAIYDEVFEPLRQMREQMLREESSPEVIEDMIKMTLGRDIEELNEATTELPR